MYFNLHKQFITLPLLIYLFLGDYLGCIEYIFITLDCFVAFCKPTCAEQFAFVIGDVFDLVPEDFAILIVFS